MLSRAIGLASGLTVLLLVASCGSVKLPTMPEVESIARPHRMEIQQGNFISQEMVAQLKVGQTKDQVRFILGSPLITDTFHGDRWDYVFWRTKANSKQLEQRKLAVFFEDNLLKRFDGDVMPSVAADPGAIKTPEKPAAPAVAPAKAASLPPPAAPQPKPAPPATVPSAATPATPAPGQPAAAKPPEPAQANMKPAEAAADAAAKQAAKQDGAGAPPELPEGPKRDTRTLWERLKDKLTF